MKAEITVNWWKWMLLGVISIAIATAIPNTADERSSVLFFGTLLYLAGSFYLMISTENITVETSKKQKESIEQTTKD